MQPMQLTTDAVLTGLSILIAVMVVVVLYHLLFIVVDVRKIVRRLNVMTEEVEAVIMKPLAMADKILQWVMHKIERKGKKHHHGHEIK